ncbi:MAG: DUF3124 domain-containing protein [Desulfobacca sp.]|uniref:DUF3124 domain-containing protein n=1 Tax=Desulfobacca sp. TaxID=2067990 RepID=UPI00404A1F04
MLSWRQFLPWVLAICLLTGAGAAGASQTVPNSWGQLVYVPVYSHIYFGDRGKTFNLSVTLSIRNVAPRHPIEVQSVQYLDETGKVVRELVAKPFLLASFAASRFFIQESDVTGGSEAAFLVRWRAAQPVPPPIIDALMVGTSFGQGISFNTSGRVLEESPELPGR